MPGTTLPGRIGGIVWWTRYAGRQDVSVDILASEAAGIQPSLQVGWYWFRLKPLASGGPFETEQEAENAYRVYKNKKEQGGIMPKVFIVVKREIWIQGVRIEVESGSEQEAKQKVADGQGEIVEGFFEYSHTLDPEEKRQQEHIAGLKRVLKEQGR